LQTKRLLPLLFLALFITLIFAACASPGDQNNPEKTPENGAPGEKLPASLFSYQGVEPGMTKEEVKDILGEPHFKEDSELHDSFSSWSYGEHFYISFLDSNDKVINIMPPETSSGIKLGDFYEKVINTHGEGEKYPSPHTSDPAYFTLHYSAGENKNIYFHIVEDKVKIIEIGTSLAD
jgi:hypothetical protein